MISKYLFLVFGPIALVAIVVANIPFISPKTREVFKIIVIACTIILAIIAIMAWIDQIHNLPPQSTFPSGRFID